MFHPLALPVNAYWQQDLNDPTGLGCYRGKEGQRCLAEKEAAIANSLIEYTAADFALEAGLKLRALNVDVNEADRFIAVGREQAARVRLGDPEHLQHSSVEHRSPYRMEAFTCWAVGLSASAPVKPPEAALLQEGARLLLQYLLGQRIQFDEVYRKWVFLAAISALAAQDLELARDLLNLRTTMPGPHYKWLKAICKGAETQNTANGPRIKITQANAVAAFFGLYNAYRLPDAQTSFNLVGRSDMFTFPVIGNYLLSWFYLQSVAQEMPASVDWALLGELMTS